MKILCTYATVATQIHNGKCYFIGMVAKDTKEVNAYNIEGGGTVGTTNKVGWLDEGEGVLMLPKPGVECSNGLHVVPAGDNPCIVYWSLG